MVRSTKGGVTISLERFLDELEQMVENSRFHLFNKVIIDEEKFFLQTSKIRTAIPEEIKRADRVTRDTEKILLNAKQDAQRIIAEGKQEADRIVKDATERASQMVSEHEITVQAEENAQQIIQAAEEHAAEIRRSAHQYAGEILERLDHFVERIGESIEEGRRSLEEASAASEP